MFSGQRFELDLDDDAGESSNRATPLPGAFVADVLERKPAAPTPPNAPTLKNKTGFPEHRKRKAESRFRQQTSTDQAKSQSGDERPTQDFAPPQAATTEQRASGGKSKTWEEEEKQRIGHENEEKLSQMSLPEIEEERRELMNTLSPAMLQRLLQRSNIDSGSAEADLTTRSPDQQMEAKPRRTVAKNVTFAEDPESESVVDAVADAADSADDDEAPADEPLAHDSVHFPQPSQPPDLDPTSETFLEDLHQKYFPSLPSDPDKLEWMQDSTSAKTTYDPSATGLKPKDLRFSFKGELIPPKTASEVPVTAGLHHHGDAPNAAGYTITELVHLGHSSFAPQRCVAFQTLGRLLYRVGKGEFGDAGEPGADTVGSEDTFGELARGLWHEVDREKAIEMLVMESEGKGIDGGKHVSAKSYATEAIWLWQKGGGRRWKAE